MVPRKSLLVCLALATGLPSSGCALTTSQFDDSAGWADGPVNGGGSAISAVYENITPIPVEPLPEMVTVRNDRGGYVVDYATRVQKLQESNTPVRFAGRCDSACTLYLALPQHQTCIARGASFSFHSPVASTRPARAAAEAYMLKTYPEWVNDWINAQGGLSRKLMTMNYNYASQHLRHCEATDMATGLLRSKTALLD